MERNNTPYRISLFFSKVFTNLIEEDDSFNDKFRTYFKKANKMDWKELWEQNKNFDPTKITTDLEAEKWIASSFLYEVKKIRKRKKQKFDPEDLNLTNQEIVRGFLDNRNFNFINWFMIYILHTFLEDEEGRERVYRGYSEIFTQKRERVYVKKKDKEAWGRLFKFTPTLQPKPNRPKGYELLAWLYNINSRKVMFSKLNNIKQKSKIIPLSSSLIILGTITNKCYHTLFWNAYRRIFNRYIELETNLYNKDNNKSLIFLVFRFIINMTIQMRNVAYNNVKRNVTFPLKKIQYKHLWRIKPKVPERDLWDKLYTKEQKQETRLKNKFK